MTGNTFISKSPEGTVKENLKLEFIQCSDGVTIQCDHFILAFGKDSLKQLLDRIELKTFKEWVNDDYNS